ncbi:toxin-antitoxin system HicB family antitoxin [bacterium]|nr:toxin-antitoxin system HicB family antitoxin [bacterium]
MSRYSGKFVLRTSTDLHEKLSEEALARGVSLNQICIHYLEGVKNRGDERLWYSFCIKIVEELKKHFKEKLVGVVVFGSQIDGYATEHSDVDLLIVLDKSLSINRSLYRWWDENISDGSGFEINPHFVSMPDDIKKTTGIWLEIAQNNEILFQKRCNMKTLMDKLNELIKNDHVRRYWSNGHPYWVWRDDEK